MPRIKRFLTEVQEGLIPQTVWDYAEVGHTQEAKQEYLQILSGQEVFTTPKPVALVKRILQIATSPGDVILVKNTVQEIRNGNGANLGFEQKLWQAADKMRGHMDAAEYKHVALGLIFLKYISDAFEERRRALLKEEGANPEDREEYAAENVFWVPQPARWDFLQKNAKQATIGKVLDDAMVAIEKENSQLKGVLPKDYARPALDKQRLGELIDLIGTIGLGDAEHRSKDILGRVYEYFLGQFASAEGKKGGESYTPRCVVRLLVEMIEPFKGRVYDPCCGSSGMFVQSEEFIQAHGGWVNDIAISDRNRTRPLGGWPR